MKILIFEYITGGGLATQPLPPTLAAEGLLMLQALLNDLGRLPQIQPVVSLDWRVQIEPPEGATVVTIDDTTELMIWLPTLLDTCDALWPIAPETDGILTRLAQLAEQRGKLLLLSNSETVAICGDKWATYQCLQAHGLPVVPTAQLGDAVYDGACVVKARDGVGCEDSRLLQNERQYQAYVAQLDTTRYIRQPYLEGDARSLSCLFKQGRGWLLCCNQQQMRIEAEQFHLKACVVNVRQAFFDDYQDWVNRIAAALPGLWGYVGIDFIACDNGESLILEINPRLTTSYVGIFAATGVNVAAQCLKLRDGSPDLRKDGKTVASLKVEMQRLYLAAQ